jgi:peptidyl-prolyl cis-trans isomerase C
MELKAQHILVKDRALAQKLLQELQRGANFEALARTHSTCPSKAKGGDLGWFGPGQMVKPFEDAVARLSPGKLCSSVVSTQFGFHIIKCTGRKD